MHHAASQPTIDPRIERVLRAWLGWGLVAVLVLPFARSHVDALGWLPMWLVAMPASALWAARRFALPHWRVAAREAGQRRRRRGVPQARRRDRATAVPRRLRAA